MNDYIKIHRHLFILFRSGDGGSGYNITSWLQGQRNRIDCRYKCSEMLDLKVEVQEATTEDGYILQLHRIPAKEGSHGAPVYIQHGLLCSSACWVTSGPKSLGFILHEMGYDVWLGNLRGNAYGRQHTHLDPDKDTKFWK